MGAGAHRGPVLADRVVRVDDLPDHDVRDARLRRVERSLDLLRRWVESSEHLVKRGQGARAVGGGGPEEKGPARRLLQQLVVGPPLGAQHEVEPRRWGGGASVGVGGVFGDAVVPHRPRQGLLGDVLAAVDGAPDAALAAAGGARGADGGRERLRELTWAARSRRGAEVLVARAGARGTVCREGVGARGCERAARLADERVGGAPDAGSRPGSLSARLEGLGLRLAGLLLLLVLVVAEDVLRARVDELPAQVARRWLELVEACGDEGNWHLAQLVLVRGSEGC